jgi:hypothetical protein
VDGQITCHDIFVAARKVPLRQLRRRLFDKHHRYTRITPSTTTISRSLCIWHDHATILKMGFILITVHVMFDPLVFLTDDEYSLRHPNDRVCIQAEVRKFCWVIKHRRSGSTSGGSCQLSLGLEHTNGSRGRIDHCERHCEILHRGSPGCPI